MKSLLINNTKYKKLIESLASEEILEYIKFNKEGVEFFYRNKSNNISIPFSNIKDMKLIIISPAYKFIGRDAYLVKSFILKFKFVRNNTDYTISLLNEEYGVIDRIFDVIHFSKYINSFSYSFRNNKKDSKKFDIAIKSYINNNYKHTFSSIGCTKWALSIQILFFLSLIIMLIMVGMLIVS